MFIFHRLRRPVQRLCEGTGKALCPVLAPRGARAVLCASGSPAQSGVPVPLGLPNGPLPSARNPTSPVPPAPQNTIFSPPFVLLFHYWKWVVTDSP